MNQSKGFIVKGQENKVCRLVKSIYDLKQASKDWFKKFHSVIIEYELFLKNLISVYIIKRLVLIILLYAYMWTIF